MSNIEKCKKILTNKKIWIGILIFLIALELVITVLYVNKHFVKFGIDADYASDSIYAKFLAKTGKLILSDDWWPTTELYIVHHQLIMTPLFHIFDDYSVVYTITTVIAFILIVLTFYYFMISFTDSKIKSLFAVLLVCNPVNYLFVLFSIIFHGYLFFVLMGVIYITILVKLTSKQVNKVEKIVFLVISFLGGLCGIRMFLILFVPLVFVFIWKSIDFKFNKEMLNIKELLRNKKVVYIMISYILTFLGYAIFYMILMPKFGGWHEFGTAGVNNTDVSNNIKDIVLIFLNTIGFDISSKKIIKLSFVKEITILVFWIYIVAKNISLSRKSNKNKELRLISMYNVVSLLTTLLIMIFTTKNEEIQSSLRYLGIAMYLFVPTAVLGLEKPNNSLKSIIKYVIAIFIIFIGMHSQVNVIRNAKNLKSLRVGYIEFLDKSDYSFGAATYWNANITTFMSKKAIEVKPVINENNLSMLEWNTRKSYENREPEFFILTKNEYENREEAELENDIVYQDDEFVIIDLKN